MITYKEVYNNSRYGRVVHILSLEELHRFIKERWLFTSPQTPYEIKFLNDDFVPSEYFAMHDANTLYGFEPDIKIVIHSTYQLHEKQTFVMGRIYNEGAVTYRKELKRYLYRIKE